MKKLLSVLLVLAALAATVTVTGCGETKKDTKPAADTKKAT